MNVYLKRGLIFSILGMVAFAAFYSYMDKWGGGAVRVTFLTLTPDLGVILPWSYNRWVDLLFWLLAMAMLFFYPVITDLDPDQKHEYLMHYWRSFALGVILTLGFHCVIGRAALPYMLISLLLGFGYSILPIGAPKHPTTLIWQALGLSLGIGITIGIVSYGMMYGLVFFILLFLMMWIGKHLGYYTNSLVNWTWRKLSPAE